MQKYYPALTNFKLLLNFNYYFFHIFRYPLVVIRMYNVLMLHGTAVLAYSLLRYSSYLIVFDSSLDKKSSPKVRSSRQQIFYKTGVTKNSAKFNGKRRCWSLFSINVQAFIPGVFL